MEDYGNDDDDDDDEEDADADAAEDDEDLCFDEEVAVVDASEITSAGISTPVLPQKRIVVSVEALLPQRFSHRCFPSGVLRRSALMLLLCSSFAVVRDGTVALRRYFPLHRVLVCVSLKKKDAREASRRRAGYKLR